MSYTAIKVEHLAKRYRIGERESSYKTFREAVMKTVKLEFLRDLQNFRKNRRYFWALNDISFEVKQGEVVGIIGHNGAGKSTLLKVLSRITEPTAGSADIYGRIGSLLEVGTGFHKELTGRENIYLSGAIMGMKKSDIDARFDEIVEFAAVEKFIDTPIKRFSSGMHLRLAFAVAAHLEPDILLVDEVLAVGDLDFQKKCLNKMEDVATAGRTVLFVSHNMGSIKELCHTGLVLKNGRIDFHGDVVGAINHYSQNILNIDVEENSELNNKGWIRLLLNDNVGSHRIYNTEPFEITADLSLSEDAHHVVTHCFIDDAEGTHVVHSRYLKFETLEKGLSRIKIQMPPLYLRPGVYTLYLKLFGESDKGARIKYISERLLIDVSDKTELFHGKVKAMILPPAEWSISSLNHSVQNLLY